MTDGRKDGRTDGRTHKGESIDPVGLQPGTNNENIVSKYYPAYFPIVSISIFFIF